VIYEIEPDASVCNAYEVPGVSDTSKLLSAPDGDLYFFGEYGFGRLGKP